MNWMIKVFLKSPSAEIHYDKKECPSVAVQYEQEEEQDDDDDDDFVFIRKAPVHPGDRLRKKTTKRFKYV